MVRFKVLFSFFLVTVILMSFTVYSSAATFMPYSGLTDTSSQVSLLYGYYRNLDTFSFDDEFIIMRSGQYEYYLFYSYDLSNSTVNYISYIGTSSNYNTVYEISVGVENNFSYILNNYSVVGNVPGTVSLSDHYNSNNSFLSVQAVYIILIFFLFYIFRSNFRELNS